MAEKNEAKFRIHAETTRVAPSMPLISVVIAVFNGSDGLLRCIDSVCSQTYTAREILVIDGGSTDGTQEIIRREQSRLSYWVSEPDRGIYHAWNKALAHARGEWIFFIGADDYLFAPDVFERMAQVLAAAYPPIRIVYGQVAVVNSRGEEVNRIGESWQSAKKRFGQIMCIPHTALMHHCSLFESRGGFDESFRIAGDYEMLLREFRERDALFVPDLIVAAMGHGGVSSTPTGSVSMLREFRRAQRMHGSTRPGRIWLSAYVKAHIRVTLWRLLGSRIAPYVFDFGRLISGKRTYWTRH